MDTLNSSPSHSPNTTMHSPPPSAADSVVSNNNDESSLLTFISTAEVNAHNQTQTQMQDKHPTDRSPNQSPQPPVVSSPDSLPQRIVLPDSKDKSYIPPHQFLKKSNDKNNSNSNSKETNIMHSKGQTTTSNKNFSNWINASKYGEDIYSLRGKGDTAISSSSSSRTNSQPNDTFNINMDSNLPGPTITATIPSTVPSSRENNEFADIFATSSSSQTNRRPSGLNQISEAATIALTMDNTLSNTKKNSINIPSSAPHVSIDPLSKDHQDEQKNNNNNNTPLETDDEKEDRKLSYIPPPPPKFTNTKLDIVRTRVLHDPTSSQSIPPAQTDPNLENGSQRQNEDIGSATATAVAVLSNLRSSPFRFGDNKNRPTSRTHSASFSSSRGTNTRPLLRIHHLEEVKSTANANTANNNTGDTTDNETAFSTEDESDSNLSDDNENEAEDLTVPKSSDDREKTITWNKNGKRINRRLSAPEQPTTKKRVKTGSAKGKSRTKSKTRLRLAEKGDRRNLTTLMYEQGGSRPGSNRNQKKAQEPVDETKKARRSRSGCWICRLRKKKCTEEKPACFNCQRLNLDCFFDAIKPDFVSNPEKKKEKMEEIKIKTREAKRNAFKQKALELRKEREEKQEKKEKVKQQQIFLPQTHDATTMQDIKVTLPPPPHPSNNEEQQSTQQSRIKNEINQS